MASSPARRETKSLPVRSLKEQAQDDLVMSTNSSSIVSKRSVERIYYPDEPHFFRFFVKKFQRRSPLINRGYHLRLHVIDVAVRDFLRRPSEKKKVVVNLGCGSDVLPWQCMTRYPDHCQGVKFVDIDFPDLMAKKCRIVQETPELNSMLTSLENGQSPHVLLRSDQYLQIGCDLRSLGDIREALSSAMVIPDCEFLFVAEVSITYMETSAADAVISWAASLSQAEFCLLEQILPDGSDHPFAVTMLKHFEKLNTPLKSVTSYPDLQSQQDRFVLLGWPHVGVESLWSTWSSDRYLSTADRQKLNAIEPFDEWEEFAIFGGHYCVVRAHNISNPSAEDAKLRTSRADTPSSPLAIGTRFREQGVRSQRRFGAPMPLENSLGETFLANTFGLGITSRLRSVDVYSSGSPARDIQLPSAGPPSRMCHTVLDLGHHGNLVIGGRSSPSSPLQDCWLFQKASRSWQRLQDLPIPVYRHASVRLGNSSLALLIGGKTSSSSVFGGCLLYHPESGWTECEIIGPKHTPVFGAILVSIESSPESSGDVETSPPVHFRGLLAGGLFEDGTVASQTLQWTLELPDSGRPTISFSEVSRLDATKTEDIWSRFGASAVMGKKGRLLVLGGIISNRVLHQHEEVLFAEVTETDLKIVSSGTVFQASTDSSDHPIPRPLLVGVSTASLADDKLLIMGGGATCFSMGTFWNKGCYILDYSQTSPENSASSVSLHSSWGFLRTVDITESVAVKVERNSSGIGQTPAIIEIPRVKVDSPASFESLLRAGKPVIIEGASLGPCVQTWTPEHLTRLVGQDRKVVVHEAATTKMDFNEKNFSYVTKEFGTFMQDVARGHHTYLRALSDDGPAERPANLSTDFPKLAEEFTLPEELSFVANNSFSSVLRVSGPVNMWLHYDVMANIYCQLVGSKRLILFPPSNVTQLSFAPGASSSSLDIFADLETTKLDGTQPHEARLNPGDILFLPPLWLHTATPLTPLSVAVNVFFRNLESGYATGRDVYGNRDLAAYEKGRQDLTRIANAFSNIPPDMREFYIRRLADELLQKING